MMKFLGIALVLAHFMVFPAAMGQILAVIEAPKLQESQAFLDHKEVLTFDSDELMTKKYRSLEFNFNLGSDSPMTATYTNVVLQDKDIGGGAGKSGRYPVALWNSSYSLTLTKTGEKGANYFGFWLSDLNGGNQVEFYSKGKNIFTFTPMIANLLRKFPRDEYFGNPNYKNEENCHWQLHAFFNFYCMGCEIEEVHFIQSGTAATSWLGSDNHTVAYVSNLPATTTATSTPTTPATVRGGLRTVTFPALKGSVSVTVEAPSVQRSTAKLDYNYTETFDDLESGESLEAKTFDDALIYHDVVIRNRDADGGAGGSGQYAVASKGSSYSLTLTKKFGERGVNYFGYWLSGVADELFSLEFYFEKKKIFTFRNHHLTILVKDRAEEYAGNPTYETPVNQGRVGWQKIYVFLNFYINDCEIDRVRFVNHLSTDFGHASDNHTVGFFTW